MVIVIVLFIINPNGYVHHKFLKEHEIVNKYITMRMRETFIYSLSFNLIMLILSNSIFL